MACDPSRKRRQKRHSFLKAGRCTKLELPAPLTVGKNRRQQRNFAMKSKSINDGVERTFVLILDQGEEAFKSVTEFADREKITGASVAAIGAFSKAKVGWFDLAAKKYNPIA